MESSTAVHQINFQSLTVEWNRYSTKSPQLKSNRDVTTDVEAIVVKNVKIKKRM